MREISAAAITDAAEKLCVDANCNLPADVLAAIGKAYETEKSPLGREILGDIAENAKIARVKGVPICQDTGFAVFFLELGQDVRITGGDLNAAIDEGVRRGYKSGYLRMSTVGEPLTGRVNRRDNTPAVVHITVVPGDKLRLIFAPKGGGSENMSALSMLRPSDGEEGFKRFVAGTVSRGGANACPPLIIGVGVGGTFEKTALLAKKALLREVGSVHPDPLYARLEAELLAEINTLGIGPQGFGGSVTALAVHIEAFPAHIASLPVAVNMQCHAARHKEIVI